MAKPNYAFEKRQKEIAKKQKKQEKQLQKAARTEQPEPGSESVTADEVRAAPQPDSQA